MMKKLLLLVLCFWGMCGIVFAQDALLETAESKEATFDSQQLFPTWGNTAARKSYSKANVTGVIGANEDLEVSAGVRKDRLLMSFLPRVLDILMKFVAPIIVIIFIWTGVRFIYAGSDDEALEKSKSMFQYAAIGLAFIVLSYTIMKMIYFFLAK